MICKCPIFDVSSSEGFLTSQQTKYSKVSSLKFSDKLKFSDRNVRLGGTVAPLPPNVYATGSCTLTAKVQHLLIKLRNQGSLDDKTNRSIYPTVLAEIGVFNDLPRVYVTQEKANALSKIPSSKARKSLKVVVLVYCQKTREQGYNRCFEPFIRAECEEKCKILHTTCS